LQHLLFLLLTLSRVFNGTESGEGILPEAVWVSDGDAVDVVVVVAHSPSINGAVRIINEGRCA
jgi:hypothetical protein